MLRARKAIFGHMDGWSFVTLELASTTEVPRGSVCRSFKLCIPLKKSGRIDEALVDREPRRATMRRFWPSEADRSGYLVRAREGWRACDIGSPETDCSFAQFPDCEFRQGSTLEVAGPDGRPTKYVIAKIEAC